MVYSEQLIISDDIIPAAVDAPLSCYANAISGGFSSGGKPCSILLAWGKVIRAEACHAHKGKPESVLYRLVDGYIGFRRVKGVAELPKGVKWAVGGMGLLGSYDPEAEGFSGAYADVLRRTAHTFVGARDGRLYLGYVHSMTAAEVNAYATALGLEHAVMLDGGHVAAIHTATCSKNTKARQYSIIQGV